MTDYLKAAFLRRMALAFLFAIPVILYSAVMLSTKPGDHPGSWLLLGFMMTGVFEVAWVGLVVVGFALHRKKNGVPLA
jgi:hypothetical protein